MKAFFFIVFLYLGLFAYEDSDMDGVDDSYDKCLYTPFTDLVTSDGCSVKSLVSPHHYDIKIGVSYSDTDYNTLSKTDILITSLQLDYYYKKFSLNFSTSYFSNESKEYSDSGMNDSLIAVSYTFVKQNLFVELGAGLILPTYETSYNNNKTDYTANINISYNIKNITTFLAYSFTQVNDIDIDSIASYQDTNTLIGGIGYSASHKIYLSASYNESDSIYKGVDKIQTLSVYSYYAFDENVFTTFNYAYGLSQPASDNYLAFKIGYYF